MAHKEKNNSVLTVKHINAFSFNLREINFNKDNSNVKFSVLNNLRFSVENNIINLTLIVTYNHPDKEPFFSMEIENIFELTGLNKYLPIKQDIVPNEMNLPENILINIASISFCHARALGGHHVSGTFAQGIYLPIIDGRSFARHIFGDDKIKAK